MRKILNAAVIGTFLMGAVPYSASAATITIEGVAPESHGPQNCIPFACPGTFGPFIGFVYQNIPAFTLNAGDVLAYDLGDQNDLPLTFNIALSATTVNGGTTETGFTQVVTGGTPADPDGDAIQGNYELAFTIGTGFVFGGGGLIVRFEPVGGSATDTSFNHVLMSSSASDPSGFFVQRFFLDNDGVSPFPSPPFVDSFFIGHFRIITDNQAPEPASLALLGLGLAGLGFSRSRK